jgi:hypothetical protein
MSYRLNTSRNWVNQLLYKPIPFKKWITGFLRSKLFDFPGVIHLFYFVIVLLLTQVLWLPIGASIILLIAVFIWQPITLILSLFHIKTGNDNGITIIFVNGMMFISMFILMWWILGKFNHIAKKKVSKLLLIIMIVTAMYISYRYYLYSIRDWWMIN